MFMYQLFFVELTLVQFGLFHYILLTKHGLVPLSSVLFSIPVQLFYWPVGLTSKLELLVL